jgi:hypothetical protein
VLEFWQDVDEEVEFQLDVLDDLRSEAMEIHKAGNDWLAYTPAMHLIREGGTNLKLLDLLDERRLTPGEVSRSRALRWPGVRCVSRSLSPSPQPLIFARVR